MYVDICFILTWPQGSLCVLLFFVISEVDSPILYKFDIHKQMGLGILW